MTRKNRNEEQTQAQGLIDSVNKDSAKQATLEELYEQVKILRGICVLLLQNLQKTYANSMRHTVTYDSMLNQEGGYMIAKIEELLVMFFSDLIGETEKEGEDE